MLIGELSRTTGVSIHTLRYYENYGLFKGATGDNSRRNKYKHYDADTVKRIRLICIAKEIGFTLSEIRNLSTIWFTEGMTRDKKIEVLTAKSLEIDKKIHQLIGIKTIIAGRIDEVLTGNHKDLHAR